MSQFESIIEHFKPEKEFGLNSIQQAVLDNIDKAGTEIELAIKEAYYDSSFEPEGDVLIAGVKIS